MAKLYYSNTIAFSEPMEDNIFTINGHFAKKIQAI